ncbi:MAG: pilus assembly protein [Planctomycetaceae bacterium]|jgi:Flp pilus assembly protein TadG|nr:pilus assembly protein [Planctomycetaceae bacterium]
MKRVDSVKTGRGPKRRKDRSGMLSAELIMTLPILAIVLFGLFEFALLFTARGELSEASRVAARKASIPGVTYDAVEEEIRRVLSPRLQRTMEVSIDQGQRSGDVVTVAIACNMNSASPDLLWPIGYSLKNRKLYEVTKMIRE